VGTTSRQCDWFGSKSAVFDTRSRLEEAATDADVKGRGLDGFDAAFYFHTSDRHTDGIADNH
jgi:hypothetical protein